MSLEAFSQTWKLSSSETVVLKHAHEILASFLFYNAVYFVSPFVSTRLFGKHYTEQNRKTRVNFDIHIVAFVQSLVSIGACAFLFYEDSFNGYKDSTIEFQLFHYDYDYSFVSALTIGYFVWDIFVCVFYYDLFGFSFLFHGIAALCVFGSTLSPYFQYWIPRFLIFELSSPFVNVNWFISKLPSGTVSMKFNAVNGILLMSTFFATRLVWGFVAIYKVLVSLHHVWGVLNVPLKLDSILVVFLNFSLDILNVIWFQKMVKIARKMAAKKKD